MYRTFCIVTLVFLVSCSNASKSPTHTFRIYEENGITIAESNNIPKYEGELFRYEKVVEIRSDTTNQEAVLYRPLGCTIDDNGLIYVADSGNHRIAVFDLEGNYLRSIGREGDGPGEFRYPMSVELIGGKLQIPSPGRQRTTIYNTDGTLEEVVTFPHARSSSYVSTATITIDGTRIIQRSDEIRGVRFVGHSLGFCTMTPAGDTLGIVETPIINTMERLDQGATAIRFGRNPQAFCDPDKGLYLSTGLPPEIDWYRFDGTHIRKIRILFEDEPVSATDRARVKSYYDQQIEDVDTIVPSEFSGSVSADYLKRQRDNAVYADIKAHWRYMQVNNSGHIWLEKYEPTGTVTYETYVHEYFILDPEGEYLGSTSTPAAFFVEVEKGYLLTSITDELTGEMIPIIYRIIPAVEGLKYP